MWETQPTTIKFNKKNRIKYIQRKTHCKLKWTKDFQKPIVVTGKQYLWEATKFIFTQKSSFILVDDNKLIVSKIINKVIICKSTAKTKINIPFLSFSLYPFLSPSSGENIFFLRLSLIFSFFKHQASLSSTEPLTPTYLPTHIPIYLPVVELSSSVSADVRNAATGFTHFVVEMVDGGAAPTHPLCTYIHTYTHT